MDDLDPGLAAFLVNFGRAECGESPGELDAIPVADADEVAGGKVIPDVNHACGEQAAAVIAEGGSGAFIDDEHAPDVAEEGDPALSFREFVGIGDEEGPLILAPEDAVEDVVLPAGRDDERDAGEADDACGLDFGDHAADGGGAGGSAGDALD